MIKTLTVCCYICKINLHCLC